MTTPRLGRRQLNRALLARQLLLERSALDPGAAIGHLVGMQSQAPNAPYIGLWTRLAGFAFDDLAELVRRRRVVRIALLRNTIHLVTAADAHRLRALLQPMMARSFRSSAQAKQLAGVDLAAVTDAGRRALEEGPLTFAELGSVLGPRWPGRQPAALAQVVRAEVPLVQVPPRGIWGESGAARHTVLDDWVAPARGPALTLQDLVRRYLGAFGPASVADIQCWSGLTHLRQIVDSLDDELIRFRDEAGVDLFDLPDAPRPDPDTPAPPRFVAEFDNILLSHAERSRIISDDHRKGLFRANGIVPGTVLLDGFVAALWKISPGGRTAQLTVTPLRTLSQRQTAAVRAEGRRLLAVAAPTVPARHVVMDDG
jgi:hypothetical protein